MVVESARIMLNTDKPMNNLLPAVDMDRLIEFTEGNPEKSRRTRLVV